MGILLVYFTRSIINIQKKLKKSTILEKKIQKSENCKVEIAKWGYTKV